LHILLTGAQGFTGLHFSRIAALAGHQVTPLKANLLDPIALMTEISIVRPDTVVHLAGISFVGHQDDHAFYDVNLFGTLNLIDALKRTADTLQCVLLASSATVYGNSPESPIAETQPPDPINHYAMSKLAMEHMARSHAGKLPLVFVRPFNYTGPNQLESFLIPKMVRHFLQRAPYIELGNLQVEREFNDVRMVCDTYLRLLQHGRPGETYNVCSGTTHSLGEVLKVLSRLTGHTMDVRVNPAFVRANEIHRLCGNPRKLESAIGPLTRWDLDETLAWVLSEPPQFRPGRGADAGCV
jgi:nucleoside-diphosphate-sugar epimerase